MTKPAAPYPAVALLGVLATYGVALAVLAASAAGTWSGQASLAVGCLVLVAPLLLGAVAYSYPSGIRRRTGGFLVPAFSTWSCWSCSWGPYSPGNRLLNLKS
ncbi:hypothetical protein [Hymenobacter nivis]|uniref:hypothetical protein n=1 Tax=Hymenobacter nivis TaxID=1850093 RepID=UPI00112E94B6|nr:hypothetical protein [Hymenobacter nivis]